MTPRQKQLDDFLNQLWQVGLWTLVVLMALIWAGLIMQIPLHPTSAPPGAPTIDPPAAAG